MSSDVCTTQEAAEILGISVTSVQQLVETGVIEAWKTKGGHRRIPITAVYAYKSSAGSAGSPAASSPRSKLTSVLVIEDNKLQRDIYEKKLSSWSLPIALTFCENGYQALVEIASHKPDVLLADIVMEGIDGYEVIKTIQTYPGLADMDIAILSSLTIAEIEQRGGIPNGVVFFGKPINYDELRGYLRACCAQKARQRA
jgi:excisionase family DNA binding protein